MTHTKCLPLALTLLLAACGGTGPSTNTPSESNPFNLMSQVLNWPAGRKGVLEAREGRDNSLGEGEIAANGAFQVSVLPPADLVPFIEDQPCDLTLVNTLEASDPNARTGNFRLLLDGSDIYGIGLRNNSSTVDTTQYGYYVYADAPVIINGRFQCGDNPDLDYTSIYENFGLVAGWNLVTFAPTRDATGGWSEIRYQVFTIDTLPSDLGWYADSSVL